ncbi:MAG: ABC transporter permease [Sulfolobaceae archaeon]|nr:ABC transporter permease [Sulfolobaceae archaeon]
MESIYVRHKLHKLEEILTKLYAFIYIRGFKVWTTYRTQVALTILSWVLPVFTYYFTGTALGDRLVTSIGMTGISYTAFMSVGIAFQGYMSSIVTTLSSRFRNEQLYGTIEYYVISKSGILGFLVYSGLWGIIMNSISAIIILAVSSALGVRYHADILAVIVLVIMLVISTYSLGMLAAAFTLIIKQGNPISFFFNTFTNLLGGTVFPIQVLPYAIRLISFALPLTWALEGLREALLLGAPITHLLYYIEILAIQDVVLFPLGLGVYTYAFKRARKMGTLSEY